MAPHSALADPFLDQMQSQINASPSTNDLMAMPPHPPPLQPGFVRIGNALVAVGSGIAAINDYIRQQASLLDHIETDTSAWWNTNAQPYTEAIKNFPLPHAYWAPGIVGDATETVMDPVVQTTTEYETQVQQDVDNEQQSSGEAISSDDADGQ